MIQLQFLNAVLSRKNSSLITLNNINDSYFSEYKDEFRYIQKHLQDYGTLPDFTSFLSAFPNFDVIQVEEPDSYLLKELVKDKNLRSLSTSFNKVRELIMSNKYEDAFSLYINSAQEIQKEDAGLNCVDILTDISRFDTYMDKCKSFNKYYVSTGFTELDELIGGWDRNEELATIVARAGTGKTWLLLKTAIAGAKQGLKVGIYSGEMSDKKVGYRIDTLMSHLSNGALIHGNIGIKDEYKNYLDNLKTSIQGEILVLTPNMLNRPATVSALQAFIEKYKLDMLCIDQHSLLEDDRKARTPVERASNISRDLKNLQVMKKIPIIAVSQQNRTSVEDGFDTTKIAQSDRIGQDSTIVIMAEQKDGVMTLHLVKSRDSVSFKDLSYKVDLDKGLFEFIPNDKTSSKEDIDKLSNRYKKTKEDVDGEEVF